MNPGQHSWPHGRHTPDTLAPMSSIVRHVTALAAALALAGCATTPPIGSKNWHLERISEIEAAYQNDEISTEAYISLKNETDQTRVEYQENMRRQLRSRRYIGFPHHHHFPYHYH